MRRTMPLCTESTLGRHDGCVMSLMRHVNGDICLLVDFIRPSFKVLTPDASVPKDGDCR
jgi:hypothetical protein